MRKIGAKKSRIHSRGSEDGRQARLFPHPVFGETVARSHDTGLDEREQAGLLTSRSFYFARLTILFGQWLHGVSSLVTAALPHGILTRFPILPEPWLWGT